MSSTIEIFKKNVSAILDRGGIRVLYNRTTTFNQTRKRVQIPTFTSFLHWCFSAGLVIHSRSL